MSSDTSDTTNPRLPPISMPPPPPNPPTEDEDNNTAPIHNIPSMQSILAAYQRASEYYLRTMRTGLANIEGDNAQHVLLLQEKDLEIKQLKAVSAGELAVKEAAWKTDLDQVNKQLEDVRGEKDRYFEKILEQQDIILIQQTLIDGLGKKNQGAEDEVSRLVAASLQGCAQCQQHLAEHNEKVASLESTLQAKDASIKSLTTRLRELEGPIQVAVRIRPGADASNQSAGVPYEATSTGLTLLATGQVPKKEYVFDNVFPPTTPFDSIFASNVRPLLRQALETPGSPAMFLFYGRTGTGKSHTAAETTHAAVEYLFSTRSVTHVNVSLCEIYKDDVFDLLANNSQLPMPRQSSTNVHLPSLATHKTVTSPASFSSLYSSATTLRTTACNTSSSRSHALLTLSLPDGGSSVTIIDLAGHEQAKQSGVVARGAAEAETRNINESLSDLRRVMENLASRKKTPPRGKRTLAKCFVGALTGDGRGELGRGGSGTASSSPRVMLFATVRLDGREHVAGTRATLDYAVRAVEMKLRR